MNLISTRHGASPSLALMGIEPLRAAIEYAGMHMTRWGDLPRGDGQSIVLFPGLAADKHSVRPLKSFFQSLGYAVHDWGRGFNTGPEGEPGPWLDQLARDVQLLTPNERVKLNLVGWSLGGIYAREVAKRIPARVQQVITLGTPFAGDAHQTNVAWVYRLLNGKRPPLDEAFSAELKIAPPMPTTSIYSRTDGIVAWQACLQGGGAPHTENIEVEGSHCGLGWNSAVLKILAERLGQQEGRWRRHVQ